MGAMQAANSHSPFSASFGSSINSPSSFGPLSNAPFLPQSMPSFAPPSSYNAAFEAANGGAGQSAHAIGQSAASVISPSFGVGGASPNGQLSSQGAQVGSFSSLANFNGPQHDSGSPISSQSVHQPQTASLSGQQAPGGSFSGGHPAANPFASAANSQQGQQYLSQQYRPDMMSIAASAPVPSSNSYRK